MRIIRVTSNNDDNIKNISEKSRETAYQMATWWCRQGAGIIAMCLA